MQGKLPKFVELLKFKVLPVDSPYVNIGRPKAAFLFD